MSFRWNPITCQLDDIGNDGEGAFVLKAGDTMVGNLNIDIAGVPTTKQGSGLTTFNGTAFRGFLGYSSLGVNGTVMGQASLNSGLTTLNLFLANKAAGDLLALGAVLDAGNTVVQMDTNIGLFMGDDDTPFDTATGRFITIFSGAGSGAYRWRVTGATGSTYMPQIEDSNANEVLKFTTTASAVNELTLSNAATGNNPILSATGGDTNIGITLTPKGSGQTQTNNFKVTGGGSFPAWTTNGIGLSMAAATYVDTTSSGTVGSAGIYAFGVPTINSTSAVTFSQIATLYIAGPPVGTGNATIASSSSLSLWVDTGRSRFDGSVGVGLGGVGTALIHIGGNSSLLTSQLGVNGWGFRSNASTITNTDSSGTIASQAAHGIGTPTFASTSVTTVTDGATWYIAGGPANGTNTTVTNPWGLWNIGKTRLDDQLILGSAPLSVEAQTIGRFQVAFSNSNNRYSGFFNFTAGATGAELFLGKSRGAAVGTYTYPTSGDALGLIRFAGADENTATFEATAAIQATADETWTSTSHATRMSFATTAVGALSNSNRLVIGSNGNVGISSDTAPAARFYLENGTAYTSAAWAKAGCSVRITGGTYTDTSSSGTVASVVAQSTGQPTFAASSATTYTDAATWYIANAPAAGTNVTLTNKYALWVDAGSSRFDGALILNDKITTYNSVATEGYGVAAIVDQVALTAQVANITTTNFTNAGTAGQYRVDYYMEDTTADITAGTLQLTIAFTDDAGATTQTSVALPLTAVGRTSGSFYIRLASGNITYATAVTGIFGTSQYALYMSCSRLN